MNYLMEVALNDGTTFNWSKKELVVGGKVYKDRIESLTQHSITLTSGRSQQTPVMTLKVQDTDKAVRSHFKDGLDSQKNSNSLATLKKVDGTTTLAKLKLTDFKTRNKYSFITFTQNTDLIKNNLLDEIKEQEYPDAVGDAYGKVIPYPCGQVTSGGNNGSYSAWKVNLNGVGHYLLSAVHLSSVDRVMHVGVNQASGWTLVNHTDGKAYLNFSTGTADTIEVNVTRTISSSLTTVIDTIFDDLLGSYGYTPSSAFIEKLERNNAQASSIRFCLDNQLIGEKFMYYFIQYFGCEWFLKGDGEIGLSWIDFKPCAGTEKATFIESDTDGEFEQDQKTNEIKNKLIWKSKYLNTSKAYKFNFTFHKMESQGNAGVFDDTLEGRFTDYSTFYFPAVKYYANINQYPPYVAKVKFTGSENVEKFLDLDLGDIIKLTHKEALTEDARYYRINKMSFNLDKNYVNVTLRDVTFLNKIESHTFLGKSGDYGIKSASQYIDDFAPDNTHRIQKYGNIKHSTDQAKFGNSSLKFVKADLQGLMVISNGDGTLDVAPNGDSDDLTIGGWIYINDVTPTYTMQIFNLCETYGVDDLRAQIQADSSFRMAYLRSGANAFGSDRISATGLVSAATWYFWVMAKVGTDWGFYIGASTVSQIIYGDDNGAGASSWTPNLFIGMRGDLNVNRYFDGFMDEPFLIQKNIFSLLPVAELTDSFTAPAFPFSDRFLRVA